MNRICLFLQPMDAAIVLMLCALIGQVLIAVYVFRHAFFFGKGAFLIGLVASILWMMGFIGELAAPTIDCKLFWAQAVWPCVALVCVSWALFLFDYAIGAVLHRGWWRTALLVGIPGTYAAIAYTNGWHGLLYGPETRLALVDGRISGVFDHGPLFYGMAVFAYLWVMKGFAVTLWGAFRAHRRYRLFFLAMLAVTIVPLSGNVAYVAHGFTIYGADPTPFLFGFVMIMLAWMVVNNQLMDINAIAKDLLFFNTSDPILVIDVQGSLAGANPEAQRLFAGLPEVGGDLRKLGALGPVVSDVLARQGALGGRALQVGARHFDLRISAVEKPIHYAHTKMGWLLSFVDVTERRYLTSALLAERDYLSTLMETSMSGIVALDGDGRIVFANAEAERIIGQPLTELRSMRHDDPVWEPRNADGSDLTDRQAFLARLTGRLGPVRDLRFSFRRQDGNRRVVLCNAAPLSHPGIEAKLVLSLSDITADYEGEVRLRAAVERAEAANRAKSRFLANMSHEIRTPLNGILGVAEILDRAATDPEMKRKLRTIHRSGEVLLELLNDVLDMSKIEAGKFDLQYVAFRPERLARQIGDMHLLGAEQKGLVFDVFTTGTPDLPRVGDPHRVLQIVQNLVSNAIKFTERGEVCVTLHCLRGQAMVIEVSDTGIGMTDEQAARIFEEFEQADGSITRRFGGTGLGMSIVKRLVAMMDGTIEVETAPEVGTTVRVSLPLWEEAAPRIA